MKQKKSIVIFLISLFCFQSLLFSETSITETSFSTGSYDVNQDISETLTIPGSSKLMVSIFGYTEDNFDFLKITDQEGNVKTFTGGVNETYIVMGDSIDIHFTSDETVGDNGVTVTVKSIMVPVSFEGVWQDISNNDFYIKIKEDDTVFAFSIENAGQTNEICKSKYWGGLEINTLVFQDQAGIKEISEFAKLDDQLIEDYKYQSMDILPNGEPNKETEENFNYVFTYDPLDSLPDSCEGKDIIPHEELVISNSGWHLHQVGNVYDLDELMSNEPNIDSIWSWNVENEKWQVKFKTEPADNPFESLNKLESNKGYWFHTSGESKVTGIIGFIPSHVENFGLSDPNGWYLLGISAQVNVEDFFIGGLEDNSTVWTWDNNQWKVYTKGDTGSTNQFNTSYNTDFENLRLIEKKQAFWVYFSEGDITPPVVVSTDPIDESIDIDPESIITVTFNEAIDSDSVNNSTFVLSDASENIAGRISYNNRVVTFTPTALSSDTSYTVTLTTDIKDTNGNTLETEYSWTFTTGIIQDVQAPTILSTNPSDEENDVSVTAKISAVFSEPLNESTIISDTFIVKDGTNIVTGEISYSNNTVIFDPSGELNSSTTYTVTLKTGIQDIAENPLAEDYEWFFTTGKIADTTAPVVLSKTPAQDAIGVTTLTSITVNFSEDMDESTINTSNFTLSDGTANISGEISYSDKIATFIPSEALNSDTSYAVNLSTEIKDKAGNSLEENVSWSFTTTGSDDPLYEYQWHLQNTGQKTFSKSPGTSGEDINLLQTIQAGYTGKGIVVTVVDTGLEINHEDLKDNVDLDTTWNLLFKDGATQPQNDPTNVYDTQGDHGTSVAGLIAAKGWNGVGGRGVAPNATLGGVNYLKGQSYPGFLIAHGGASSGASPTVNSDIFNMSYGLSTTDEKLFDSTLEDHFRIMIIGDSETQALRDGKGAIYVKASGNGFNSYYVSGSREHCDKASEVGITCQNANMDYQNATPWFIVVGALNARGLKSSYSTAGSAIWISAPGGEYGYYQPAMITTDQSGCDKGYSRTDVNPAYNKFHNNSNELNTNCDYASTFNGTSSATPVASGGIALILEANPELNWREVRHILAKTAEKVDEDNEGLSVTLGDGAYQAELPWITNNAGYHFHNYYGFGRIDVDAAVTMAKTFSSGNLGDFVESEWNDSEALSLAIPDNSKEGISNTISVTSDLVVEAVQIKISLTHTYTGDIGIELTSPSGTNSILFNIYNGFYESDDLAEMVLLSNAFYGENTKGDWKIKVIDGSAEDTGELTNWQIRFYGHAL